jgi:hypothetical protein
MVAGECYVPLIPKLKLGENERLKLGAKKIE